MGSANRSVQSSSSSNTGFTYDSALSKEQLKILQNREAQYNSWFFPELQSALAATDVNSAESQAKMSQQAGQIGTAYNSAMQQTNQSLAQQGLLGTAGGVNASLTAANQRAKASSLANAYYNTLSDNASQKTNLLQIGASLMPSTTTSATYHQYNSSESNSTSVSSGESIL